MIENQATINVGKNIVGLSNIIISDVDGNIFINNNNQITEGIKNSLAIYSDDGCNLISSGVKLIYKKEDSTLSVESLVSEKIKTETISSDGISTNRLVSENIDSEYVRINCLHIRDYSDCVKFSIKNWLGFESKKDNSKTPYKFKIFQNSNTKKESLGIVANDYSNELSKISLIIDDTKIYLKHVMNLSKVSIKSPVGKEGDSQGDIVFDGDYIFYCTNNYDGQTKIWKKLKVEDW